MPQVSILRFFEYILRESPILRFFCDIKREIKIKNNKESIYEDEGNNNDGRWMVDTAERGSKRLIIMEDVFYIHLLLFFTVDYVALAIRVYIYNIRVRLRYYEVQLMNKKTNLIEVTLLYAFCGDSTQEHIAVAVWITIG